MTGPPAGSPPVPKRAAEGAPLPLFAVFDDFSSSQRIFVWVRWLIISFALFAVDYRPTLPPLQWILMNVIILAATLGNGYFHWRLVQGHRFGRGTVIISCVGDIVAITGALVLTRRFESSWFVLYYPSLLVVSVVFAPRLTFLYTTGVAAVYAALSLGLAPGVDFAAQGEKILAVRLIVMYAVAAVGNFVVMEERQRRRQAVAAERSRGQENLRLYQSILFSLALAAEAKDAYTEGHLERVSRYALRLGRYVGLGPADLEILYAGALLHDIGKLGVPDAILNKPDKLTAEEWALMRRHPEAGERILSAVVGPGIGGIREVVLCHHEWVDGSGYPRGLHGDELSAYPKIVAIADMFDALITARPYRPALPDEEALALMGQERGRHLDAELLDLFVHRRLFDDAHQEADAFLLTPSLAAQQNPEALP